MARGAIEIFRNMNDKQRIDLKKQTIAMRLRGLTFPKIEKQTGVARGTLDGWFKGLALPDGAKKKIMERIKRDSWQKNVSHLPWRLRRSVQRRRSGETPNDPPTKTP